VHCIRAQEAETGERVRPKRPRAVILEPTRELAQQARRRLRLWRATTRLCGQR
jgi:superfamily II DNA/RNA helicase